MPDDTAVIGYPFPVSTDKIAQGAVNMQDIDEAVEASLYLKNNAFSGTDPWTAYPDGLTLMRVGSATGFPYSAGYVVTHKSPGTVYVYQWFFRYTSSGSQVYAYIRQGWTPSGGSASWTDWKTVTGPGTPVAMASGEGSVDTTSGNQVDSAKITFPSGRFTAPPDVQITARSVRPDYVSCTVSDITATSMTVYISRPNGDAATSFNWTAIQI